MSWLAAIAASMVLGQARTPPPAPSSATPDALLRQLEDLMPGGVVTGSVGDYAVYKLPASLFRYWRIAVVGQEMTASGRDIWLESSFGNSPTGKGMVALKVLTRGNLREGGLLKAYFRIGAGKTLQLAPDMLASAGSNDLPPVSAAPDAPENVELKQTPAGAFRALRCELPQGMTMWIAPEVPVLHLVAAHVGMGGDIELAAYGHDATDTMGEPAGRIGRGELKQIQQMGADGGQP